jgi:hypothetical protein
MEFKDYYKTLELTPEASKKAYQTLAKAAPFNPRRHLGVQG